ncbi:MAG TPA: hypothetical protein VGD64_15285, partial [Acidisarcina sp.]
CSCTLWQVEHVIRLDWKQRLLRSRSTSLPCTSIGPSSPGSLIFRNLPMSSPGRNVNEGAIGSAAPASDGRYFRSAINGSDPSHVRGFTEPCE